MGIEGEIKTEDKNKSHRGVQGNYYFEQLMRFPWKHIARKIGAGKGIGHRPSITHADGSQNVYR